MNIHSVHLRSDFDRLKLAIDPFTSQDILEVLSTDEKYEIRKEVAKNKNTPIKILKILSQDEYWSVRRGVAVNRSTPIYLLEHLSNDPKNAVREEVAKNLNTPSNILVQLSKDYVYTVVEHVSLHPFLPEQAQIYLTNHPIEQVRISLANNKKVTLKVLNILSRDTSRLVREAVIGNRNTTIGLIKEMCDKEDIKINIKLSRILTLSKEISKKEHIRNIKDNSPIYNK